MKRRVARNSSPEDTAHREHDGHAHTPGRKLGRPGLKLCLLPYFLTTWSVLGKLRKDAGIHSQPVQGSLGLRQDGSGTAVIGGKTASSRKLAVCTSGKRLESSPQFILWDERGVVEAP